MFPLTTHAHDYDGFGNRLLKLAVVSERDFSLFVSTGLTDAAWQPEFMISNWGTNCAVVFVPPGSTNNGYGNMVRMMCHMAYPMAMFGPPTSKYQYFANIYNAPTSSYTIGNLGQTSPSAAPPHMPKSFLTRIPGPMKAVLFVVLGNYERNTAPVVIIQSEGRTISINGVDNGPITPFTMNISFLSDPAGESNSIIKFMSGSHFIPALLAYIREWESFFGNNSDRSSALRFWAEHSRLYGFKGKVASDLEIGTSQKVVCAPVMFLQGDPPAAGALPRLTGMPDMPLHLQSTSAGWTKSLLSLRTTRLFKTTATGLLTWEGHLIKVDNSDQTKHTYYVDNTYLNSCSVVPAQDVLIDYLVYRKWVYPLEEYPTALLSDAARVSLTIAMMSNMIGAGADAIYQAHSMGVTPFYLPSAVSAVETINLMLNRQVWPTLESMLTMGIQYPSVFNIRDSLPFYHTSELAGGGYLEHFGQALATGRAFSSVARIPRELVGQWVPSLMPIWNRLRLNIPVMRPSRAIVTNEERTVSLFSIFICPDETGVPPAGQTIINSLLSRISQGVVAVGVSRNVGFVARNQRDGKLRPYFFSFRFYNEYRDQLIVAAMGRAAPVIPAFTNVGLPVVESVGNRDYIFGFDPVRLLSLGPTDAYGPGDGSYGYIMYYNMSGGFSTITTNAHATVPDSIFTGDGMSNFLNFL
ncbi:putative coat protein [Lampyris noctiluca toti-like virus 1]|nr:putative coat protein [Lampyris noctiluca toti-like virus 1]